MKKVNIKDIYGKDYVFVDVRTPKEFEEDSIPGAINIPLFSDEERAIVGTIYSKESKDKAITKGLEFVDKNLSDIFSKFNRLKGNKIVIFCWRGGMRSRSLCTLMETIGFKVYQLEGGYKSYRRHVIDSLDKWKPSQPVFIIHGRTGSGKTDIIKNISYSIDLEGLAQHRGSFFGDIGLKQNSQKKFESLLFSKLTKLKNAPYLITEGESRKIGKIQIPESFWKAMKKGNNILLEIPIKKRIKIIMRDYGSAPKKILKEKVQLLKKILSKKDIEKINHLIDNDLEKAISIILIKYYDPLYDKGIDKKNFLAKANTKKKIKEIIENSI